MSDSAAPSATAPAGAAVPAASAAEMAAQFERVLFRLSTISDEEQLQHVLASLLPMLMMRLRTDLAAAPRAKLLEVLSHINKRVKDRRSIRLPVADLLQCLSTCDAFAVSFIMMYVRLGVDRLASEEAERVALSLLRIASFPASQLDALCHVLLRCLPSIVIPPTAEAQVAKLGALMEPANKAILFPLFLDTLLFLKHTAASAPSPGATPRTADAVASGGSAQAPAAAAAPASAALVASPGMSGAPLTRIVGPDVSAAAASGVEGVEELRVRKRTILRLADTSSLWSAEEALLLFIGASADTTADINTLAEERIKRLAPSANVESATLVTALTALMMGSALPDARDARTPGPPAVRIHAMSLLSRSRLAATAMPGMPKLVFECLYGKNTLAKLQLAGLRLLSLAVQTCESNILTPLAPLFVFQGLLRFLQAPAAAAAAGACRKRSNPW
ncbi:MAG: hypothetical protein EOO41_00315, partial [Methanobacteriota archaeon]